MKTNVYAIRDLKGGIFCEPFVQNTHGVAERAFSELLRNPQSLLHKYPEDYQLFQIGEYDDNSGLITSLKAPLHICSAQQLLKAQSAAMN